MREGRSNYPISLHGVGLSLGSAAAAWSIYRRRETPIRKLPIDVVGLTLLVLAVAALQIMLDRGKELDWFHSGEIITLGLVALIGGAFFIAWELTDKHPVVNLRLFAGRNFSFGAATLSLLALAASATLTVSTTFSWTLGGFSCASSSAEMPATAKVP